MWLGALNLWFWLLSCTVKRNYSGQTSAFLLNLNDIKVEIVLKDLPMYGVTLDTSVFQWNICEQFVSNFYPSFKKWRFKKHIPILYQSHFLKTVSKTFPCDNSMLSTKMPPINILALKLIWLLEISSRMSILSLTKRITQFLNGKILQMHFPE